MSDTLTIDPEKPPQRKISYFACVRCGRINPEFGTFAGGSLDRPRFYCLVGYCIPWRVKLKMWWRDRRT